MATVTIIAVGKIKDAWMRAGIDEYSKRMRAYCKFDIIEIPEHKLPLKPSGADIAAGLEKEAQAITAKIPTKAKVFAMCIEGKMLSSDKLSDMIAEWNSTTSHIVFIIGSSHGLEDGVKKLADFKLSISPMTFPHQLARVVLAEQIYRALSIQNGSKYHK